MSQELRDSLTALLDAPLTSTMQRLRMPVATDLGGLRTLRALLTQPNPPVAIIKQLIGSTEIEQAGRVGLPEPVMQVVHLAAIATAIVHRQIRVKDEGPIRDSLNVALERDWIGFDLVQLFEATLVALDELSTTPVASLTETLAEIHSAGKSNETSKTEPGSVRDLPVLAFWKSENVRRIVAGAVLFAACIPLACNLMAADETYPEYEGYHDPAKGALITGWVWDKSAPDRPVEVTIEDGKNPVVTVLADLERPDLADKGNGRHGFAYAIPGKQRDGRTYSVWVRIAGTRRILDETPRQHTYR